MAPIEVKTFLAQPIAPRNVPNVESVLAPIDVQVGFTLPTALAAEGTGSINGTLALLDHWNVAIARMGSLNIAIVSLIAWLAVAPAHAQDDSSIAPFSRMTPGSVIADGWKPLTFKGIPRHTEYRLVSDAAGTVVEADARISASGLVHAIDADITKLPILRWRWKVENLIENADVHTKAGDDYPARLYVTFAYDSRRVGILERAKFELAESLYGAYPPIAALNYVWDGIAPAGTSVPNAYTKRAHMIVVESGPMRVGEWVTEERNILDDYRSAFGGEPPPISGIAIMTDTDNTAETARAWFGDIELTSAPGH